MGFVSVVKGLSPIYPVPGTGDKVTCTNADTGYAYGTQTPSEGQVYGVTSTNGLLLVATETPGTGSLTESKICAAVGPGDTIFVVIPAGVSALWLASETAGVIGWVYQVKID